MVACTNSPFRPIAVAVPSSILAPRLGPIPPEHMETVSVGLPVYNGERYLEVAIRSVLAQSWTKLELIICDNSSTDGTEAICRRFIAQDPRVRYHRNARNIGAAGNFCLTFELSSGAYFRWLSADDYIGPTSVEKCVALLERNPDAVLACTRAVFVNEHGAETHPYDEAQALEQTRACERFRAVFGQDSWCNAYYGLFRRETFARTALMQAFPGADHALLAELAMYGRFLEVPEPLFFRRIHPGAYSYGVSAERDRAFYTPEHGTRSEPMIRAWRHRVANVRAVMRSPAGMKDKMWILEHILRRAWWEHPQLLREARKMIFGGGRG
jgi:glycosyltransferase involved in cell wall biosynthesis